MDSAVPDQAQAAAPTLEDIASFPEGYFLENLVMRHDRSILVTVHAQKELWLVPPVDGVLPLTPLKLAGFETNVLGIAEIDPEVFLIATCDFYHIAACRLLRLDLREWRPGTPVSISPAMTFPSQARGLNGMCRVGPRTLLVADSFASLIWRVDIADDGSGAARTWLKHPSMGYFPGALKPEQPGVNGLRYDSRRSYLYYTSTAQKLLMRVHLNPWSLEAEGEPELVVAGRMGDDFCIDEEGGVLYLATHRQNTLDRVSMDPAKNSGFTDSVLGAPFDSRMVGPTSMIWSNGEAGRVGYLLTDGGTASPPAGGRTVAKLLRVTFEEARR